MLVAGLTIGVPSPALAQAPAPAQPPRPDLEAFQGRPVRRVVFVVAPTSPSEPPGVLPVSDETLTRNQLRMIEGGPFDTRVVGEDVARLNRLGRFRRVEASARLLADGSVELTYTLALQPMITAVQTVGNRAFDDDELIGGLRLEGTPVDPTLLERLARRMEDQYKAKGYYNAKVSIDEQELEDSGIVVFRVREGHQTRVGEVRFEGVTAFPARQLRKPLKTKEAWFLDRLRGSAGVDNDLLDEDVGTLIAFYKDRGYLDVRVDRVVSTSADGSEAVVTFIVEEGRVYTLRDVTLKLAPGEDSPLTEDQVVALLRLKPGDLYNEAAVQGSIRDVAAAFGVLGYAEARIGRELLREPGQPLVDLRLVVTPGRRFRTGMIEVRGNTATRGDIIREQITLLPERPLDPNEIEESRQRIERLRLFATGSVKTAIQPEREDEPGYRDVIFEVEETMNRSFNFGAAVSSDGGVTAQIGVTQRNFDITDLPDSWSDFWRGQAFYGGGQTFNIQVLPGDRVRIFQISLSDPYAWGSDYSLSTSAYFRDRIYAAYDEQRVGTRLTVGRRFGSRWSISFPVSVEKVQLSNADEDAPTEYFEHEDGDVLAAAGVVLSRTAVDNITFPSKGSKAEFGLTQVFGDYNFTKVSGEYSRYFKLDEDALGHKTVLQLSTRASYIPQGQDNVPFYERYYMGGSSFRGFGYRAIAPIGIRNDTGGVANDTVGGVFSFFAGAELRRPILTELVSGVLFIDTGTVDDDFSFDHYRVSAGFGVRIYIEQLSQAPLAFDFGFPLIKEDTDETQLFTFSIDVPFR
ncbi:MAG: hypothetical protein HBSAPP03_09440 [Phycisphaerae bacterium]|nr:MAG: hypothetical protein HBSAPP03_09440 [Phycisphaerae bacterium]